MSDVFYLRPLDPPIEPGELGGMFDSASGCFNTHRVDWRGSFLKEDGAALLCWYRAPDMEAARVALRKLGADLAGLWPAKLAEDGDDEALLQEGTTLLAEFVVDPEFQKQRLHAALAELRAENPEAVQAIDLGNASRFLILARGIEKTDALEIFRKHGLEPDTCFGGEFINPTMF